MYRTTYISWGLLGLLIAFTYDPSKRSALDASYWFPLSLLILGTVPSIGGIWNVWDHTRTNSNKRERWIQLLIQVLLTGIQLAAVIYFLLLRSIVTLSLWEQRALFFIMILTFILQSVLLDFILRRLHRRDSEDQLTGDP